MGNDLTHTSAQMKTENATNGLTYGNPVALPGKVCPRGSMTKEDIERNINFREHGYTRFNDTWLVFCYIGASLDMIVAARAAGYRGNTATAAYSLRFRLARINPLSFLDIVRSLMNAKLVCKSTFKGILSGPFDYRKKCKGWSKKNANFYNYFAKRLVTEALVKYKGSLVVTAQQLCVDVETVEYWMALKVESVLAKPIRYMPDAD